MPGLYFATVSVGQTFKHALPRTAIEANNVFFRALTHNPALMHIDEHYGQKPPFHGDTARVEP